MPVPVGQVPPQVAEYLSGLEVRIAALEGADGPKQVFASTTANLPDPADFFQCVLLDTTLNILAVSDGSDWIRQDTGAPI